MLSAGGPYNPLCVSGERLNTTCGGGQRFLEVKGANLLTVHFNLARGFDIAIFRGLHLQLEFLAEVSLGDGSQQVKRESSERQSALEE